MVPHSLHTGFIRNPGLIFSRSHSNSFCDPTGSGSISQHSQLDRNHAAEKFSSLQTNRGRKRAAAAITLAYCSDERTNCSFTQLRHFKMHSSEAILANCASGPCPLAMVVASSAADASARLFSQRGLPFWPPAGFAGPPSPALTPVDSSSASTRSCSRLHVICTLPGGSVSPTFPGPALRTYSAQMACSHCPDTGN